MNENPPELHPEEQENIPNNSHQENLENINDVYAEAREHFYDQRKDDEQKQRELFEHTKSILEDTKHRASDASPETVGTEYAPTKESRKGAGMLKQFAIAAGIALAGLLPAKEAKGSQKVQDKVGSKTEASAPSPEHNEHFVSNHLRQDWNDYVDWLDAHHLKGSDTLDSRAVANKMINQFIAERQAAGKPVVLTVESVSDIQKELIRYRNWYIEQVEETQEELKKGEHPKHLYYFANPDGSSFSKDQYLVQLKKEKADGDGIAGENTTRTKFSEAYMQYVVEQKTHFDGMGDVRFASNKEPLKYEGFSKIEGE